VTLPPRWTTALKAGACVLFVGHMVATCAQAIPEASALRPISAPFRHYQEMTGLWQTWDMFTTIPYFHDYGIDLTVTETDGRVEHAGVLLPGLRDFDREVRTETLFMRYQYDPEFGPYRQGYIEKACGELRARSGHGGQKIAFHESCQRMRWLNQIRLDAVIANPEEHSSQVFACRD
jgi:hypothetical protein